MAYKILLLGASYGSLLGVENAVWRPFHPSHLPARRGRLINQEGFKVRLPIRGRKDRCCSTRKSCPAR